MFLDGAGQCSAKKREFKGNLDNLGRPWTPRRVLHNRRAPVRFLSHLPASPEFIDLRRHGVQSNLRILTPVAPNGKGSGGPGIEMTSNTTAQCVGVPAEPFKSVSSTQLSVV